MGRYRIPVADRADRYAEYARILLEMSVSANGVDEELMTLACSYLDMAIRERLNGGGNKATPA